MPAPASYARRQFPGNATDTTISAGINNSVTACALTATTGWPTGAYTGGVLCELYSTTTGATAEKVWATDLTGSTLTIVRAADGTSAASHSAGTGIRPIAGAIDADEANRAVNETIGQVTTAGDILVADGAASLARLAVGASGRILVSNGTTLVWVAMSGDATISSAGAVSIGNSKITNAMMADNAVGTAELADDAVTLAELAAAAKPRWSIVFTSVAAANITATSGETTPAGAMEQPSPILGDAALAGFYIPYVAPEAGAIVGLSVALVDARTAGTISFEVYKNGVATGLTALIDDSPTKYQYATQAESADTFSAGDRIDVRYTSSATFAPTSPNTAVAHVLLQSV